MGAWDSEQGSDAGAGTFLRDLDRVISPLRAWVFTSGGSR